MREYIESLESNGTPMTEEAWIDIITKEIDDIKTQNPEAETVDIDDVIEALFEDGFIIVTRSWKVYGANGHRQRESFSKSYKYDFSEPGETRIIDVECADKTGTHDYVIVRITRNSYSECYAELEGQLTDGIFENSRTGYIEEI